jgi:hypothetical protein
VAAADEALEAILAPLWAARELPEAPARGVEGLVRGVVEGEAGAVVVVAMGAGHERRRDEAAAVAAA